MQTDVVSAVAPGRKERAISLDDKYTQTNGHVFMTGTQALVRLPLLQHMRDKAAGLNTAGYVSGYRGSPLGGLDQALAKAEKFLAASHIKFQPGLNEELAATAVWGTQQVNLFPGARYDGVFALWYGKGPGVDRSCDVFKHGNAAGTWKHGGVLVLAGDDHAAKSSTLAHQSEHTLAACLIPTLHPSNVQEYLDYGLHGLAMSRYSGAWVAMKCVTDVVESGAVVSVDPQRVQIAIPTDLEPPQGGNGIRLPDVILDQETRLVDHKLQAALAYCRANRLDRMVWDREVARLGIMTTGKAHSDTMQALADLGIDRATAASAGIRLYKVAMPWPLEPEGALKFALGLEEVLVVEEKRSLMEIQLRDTLYEAARRPGTALVPRIVGKTDGAGEWQRGAKRLLPATYELSPALVAEALAQRFAALGMDVLLGDRYAERLALLRSRLAALRQPVLAEERTPYFCSGCPHNTSTRVPEGSRATAAIGCHFMAVWMDRATSTYTQMGGEGGPWLGQAAFTETRHIFVNQGDGTYFHSGVLAIRAAVAAKVNATYKILFNDAVAMTGGQPHDGPLDPLAIARQVWAEGVGPIAVVTDEPEKYSASTPWPDNVRVHHRDELDAVMRDMRERPGITAIIYDQTCASEKRRRRKRGDYPDPAKRILINEAVCEGCGDCSVQSNCLSVEPLETEFGRKREINQSTCNKDYSCVKGFCPSFVTVLGGTLKKPKALAGKLTRAQGSNEDARPAAAIPALPAPLLPQVEPGTYQILVTGVGGTGVVTIGQIIAMAAHLDGLAASVLDMSGLAQKGGPVLSHVRIAAQPEHIHSTRVGLAAAHLVIGCDQIVTAAKEAVSRMGDGTTRVVLNATGAPTAAFVKNPDWAFPGTSAQTVVRAACGSPAQDAGTGVDPVATVDAGRIATALLGDGIATNMFMLGFAWQRGWLPLNEAAILKAIEINGVQVDFNVQAFAWGRFAAHDLAAVENMARPSQPIVLHLPARAKATEDPLKEPFSIRLAFLTDYQNAAYAQRYRVLVERVHAAEQAVTGTTALTDAVMRYYFKLLAYKDEFEVARLYSLPAFRARVEGMFEGEWRLHLNLAPPMLNRPDARTGVPSKTEFGPWILPALNVLAKFRFLRGTRLDPFGYSEERRTERRLIVEYEALIAHVLQRLEVGRLPTAVALASLPEQIRGYGHVKARHLVVAEEKRRLLLERFDAPAVKPMPLAA